MGNLSTPSDIRTLAIGWSRAYPFEREYTGNLRVEVPALGPGLAQADINGFRYIRVRVDRARLERDFQPPGLLVVDDFLDDSRWHFRTLYTSITPDAWDLFRV